MICLNLQSFVSARQVNSNDLWQYQQFFPFLFFFLFVFVSFFFFGVWLIIFFGPLRFLFLKEIEAIELILTLS